jgi:O-acetyl-ADP-ribose deacetylase (regulator of RNase III)
VAHTRAMEMTHGQEAAPQDSDDEARWYGASVRLLAGDITRASVDAVVNAANSALAGGGGVDGAIHAAAGPSLMAELRERYDGCPTGAAVITDAGDLPARHVIHAVGPVWRGGDHDEAALLGSAYRSSLDLASAAHARSVAFAAISCGVYGYPLDDAAQIALGTVRTWLASHPGHGLDDIIFVLRGTEVMAAFRRAMVAPQWEESPETSDGAPRQARSQPA